MARVKIDIAQRTVTRTYGPYDWSEIVAKPYVVSRRQGLLQRWKRLDAFDTLPEAEAFADKVRGFPRYLG